MALVPEEVMLARVRREVDARASADEALRVSLADVESRLTAEISKLKKKVTATVNGSVVNASALAGLIQRVQVEPGFALAEQVTTLEARVDDNMASYDETIRVLVDSVHAEATKTETLTSRFAGNEAKIVNIESTYASKTFAEVKASQIITASLNATGAGTIGGTIASLSSVYATPGSVTSAVSSSISASISGTSAGTIGAAINTEAEARADADGYLSGDYKLTVSAGTNVVTGMRLTANNSTPDGVSEIAFTGSVFKVYNGASNVAPFTVNTTANTVTLTNVIVDTLAANISIVTPTIASPVITGGVIQLAPSDGAALLSSTGVDGQDKGIIRVNGGGGSGDTRGGQIDLFGNEYETDPAYPGAILITPGRTSVGSVRIRSNTAGGAVVDRIIASASGVSIVGPTTNSGNLNVTGTFTCSTFSQSSLTLSGPISGATTISGTTITASTGFTTTGPISGGSLSVSGTIGGTIVGAAKLNAGADGISSVGQILTDTNVGAQGNVVAFGQGRFLGGLGVGNSETASTPGTVVRQFRVFDSNGTPLGYVPIYSSIF